MRKLIFAVALFAVSGVANAVQVYLVQHNINTNPGVPTTYINDDSHPDFSGVATDAIWDWDAGTGVLSSTGNYTAAIALGSAPTGPGLLQDQIVALSIDTTTSTASATSYACENGSFLGFVQFCGGYDYGGNYVNESTLTYGPGTSFSITPGGDDAFTAVPPEDGVRNIIAYNFGLESDDGTTIIIGTGVPIGTAGAESLKFSTIVPVPAAAWLFGSALGLLGWARRRAAV